VIRTKLPLAFTALLFFSLLNWHCTKINNTDIGGELIPTVDNVTTFEEIVSVIANNIDSIPAGKGCTTIYPTDDHVLGTITNDPLFGTTKATIYTEFKPPVFPFSLSGKPAERILDSIVLILSYRKTFGDSLTAQTVEVHEINASKGFLPDSSSCTSYSLKATVLGSKTYIPKSLNDSVKAFRDTSKNQLRIKLSAALGQQFLAQDSSNVLNAFKSDTLFRDFFKGFAIVPGNSGNALSYFSLVEANSRLALYYKFKNAAGGNDTTFTNFTFNRAANSANNITRLRAGSEITQNVSSAPAGHNFIYIQTSPGSYAELKIPALSGLSNRITHKAELIVEQASPNPLDPFAAPNVLFLDLKQNDSVYRNIPCDFTFNNSQPDIITFGGFKTIVNGASRYSFNLTRYIQKIVTNKRENSTLRLRAPDYVINFSGYIDDCGQGQPPFFFPLNSVAFGRVKLVGGSTAPNRIRVRIIYSKL
jgi:hypothetical protein